MLEKVLEKVLAITDMDAGEISLYNPAERRLRVYAYQGLSAEWLADEAERPTTCLCRAAIHAEGPLCVSDIHQDERVVRPACVREGFRGFCAVPLRTEEQILGVMTLHGHQACQDVGPKLDLLAAIGNQIAMALLNVQLYAETQRMARTDPLTGLVNRRVFEERLDEEVHRAQRYAHPLSVVMADLDHFKRYNDTHGHQAGDVALQQLGEILQANVRETDLVARYGGEEFVILLPETSKAGALALAEKIRAAVEMHPFPYENSHPSRRLTLCLGVAAYREGVEDSKALLRRADEALYQAKAGGRNRVCSQCH